MANINERFGILNASEVRLRKKSTKKTFLKIPQANHCTFEYKTTQKVAKEQGIEKLYWSTTPVASYKMSTETISFPQLAQALGSAGMKLNTTNSSYGRTETFTVATDGTLEIILKAEPILTGSAITFHKLTQDNELDSEELSATVDGTDKKKYVITNVNLKVGDKVEVNYDESLVANKVYTFQVGSGYQGEAMELIANVLRKNVSTNKIEIMQMYIPNVVTEAGITINFDSENPSKFDITLKVLGDPYKSDENGNPLFCEFRALAPTP